ncbi:ribonuclease HI [Chroococcidiopsis sp. TS-821]|uniref:ribonuclease HI n=1 Tax=Chroococcidiopsis sp. TS-821 TaxID=1378066 RepID=UPI000CEF4D30|nr:ribonuclease HI [Chroococcidiopsis sp. TS-821]PPS40208.1 ribonuclease HI [Chroococcidiopsis sp. TS-821]
MPAHTIKSIYTDGACTGNPGPGGWAVVIYFADGSVQELGGYEAQTTNNRMEMQAAIAALELLSTVPTNEPITLYTDSEYLIKGITQWVKGWKKKGWKTAQGKPVLNQDLWEILDARNTKNVQWQYVRGHAGNIGNERCDEIARAFATGKTPTLQQPKLDSVLVTEVSDCVPQSTITYETTTSSHLVSDMTMIESSAPNSVVNSEEIPRETRVALLRSLVETLRIADEIAAKGYLITSSELADLMDVHASAVTSRGDEWRWRNWIVSRVRREGNQILWELERADQVNSDDHTGDPATE